ncbi:hypothetical protein DSM19430T_27110 [Desulfovibrio psychrotolerans]|uniref:Uncharacterized protein n=1 Tax=Desulfovibrio psychrotolerans TaxID=415242 RepID=A0A7J0BWD7_9BACT|nr:hypothetical protein DSM19430T_27110 [Desulfovibrio psychrotolerans]
MKRTRCLGVFRDSDYVEVDEVDLRKCRVCGEYSEDYYPWGESGDMPTFDLCSCCKVQFGYEDVSIKSIVAYRNRWMSHCKNVVFCNDMYLEYDDILRRIPQVFLNSQT